jgi:triphosphoribosyl-dephospho-CoA synthase
VTGLPAAVIADLFRAACRAELEAPKPGNVHVYAQGHGMTVADFVASAQVAAPKVADPGLTIGERVLAAVEATRAACGQNTNLGILLLCAPLAAAAEAGGSLRTNLARALAGLDRRDAVLAYRAIRLASPGGLGRSDRHDVAEEPTVTLLEAMREAAARDRIAAQYANGFADVFAIGVARLLACRRAGWAESWAMAGSFLALLAAYPDTHVARRHGIAVAEELQVEAGTLDRVLRAAARPESLSDRLLALDLKLKRRGINPGTSADLTVASHFAAGLELAMASGLSSTHRISQS